MHKSSLYECIKTLKLYFYKNDTPFSFDHAKFLTSKKEEREEESERVENKKDNRKREREKEKWRDRPREMEKGGVNSITHFPLFYEYSKTRAVQTFISTSFKFMKFTGKIPHTFYSQSFCQFQ